MTRLIVGDFYVHSDGRVGVVQCSPVWFTPSSGGAVRVWDHPVPGAREGTMNQVYVNGAAVADLGGFEKMEMLGVSHGE